MRFKLSYTDSLGMYDVLTNQTFDIFTIVRINGLRVMFFHNDKPNSKDGLNEKMIEKFKRLHQKGLVDKFICCYPETTGISKYCLLGRNAKGEISLHQDHKTGWIYLSCKKD